MSNLLPPTGSPQTPKKSSAMDPAPSALWKKKPPPKEVHLDSAKDVSPMKNPNGLSSPIVDESSPESKELAHPRGEAYFDEHDLERNDISSDLVRAHIKANKEYFENVTSKKKSEEEQKQNEEDVHDVEEDEEDDSKEESGSSSDDSLLDPDNYPIKPNKKAAV